MVGIHQHTAAIYLPPLAAELWALDHRQFIMQKPLGGRHFQFHDAKNRYAQTELLQLIPLPSKPNAVRRAANKLRRLLIGQ
jgi:hypothetical protein